MAGLQALFGENTRKSDLKRLYDPRLTAAKSLSDMALSGAPAQGGWGEAIARVVAGGLSGKYQREAEAEQEGKDAGVQDALSNALRLGQGWAPETKEYSNGTKIDWQGQEGDMGKMAQALMANTETAPIGMGVQGAMLDNKMAIQAEMAKAMATREAKANEPITPYQQAKLGLDREKINKKDNGITMTMPDGSVVQVGGNTPPVKEYQAQASSRSNLIANGLKMLEENVGSPEVNPWRSAFADTVSGFGPLGEVVANKIRTDAENLAGAGRDSAIEGFASAVTGAGVTTEQFTRFKNMWPKAGESKEVRRQKFNNAYSFLLNQTNIAGPIAEQLRQEVLKRNTSNGGLAISTQQNAATPLAASAPATVPQQAMVPIPKGQFNAAAAKEAGYTDAEIQQYLRSQ